jgi:YVTN family beta-propeller protein
MKKRNAFMAALLSLTVMAITGCASTAVAPTSPHYAVTHRYRLDGDRSWDYLTFDPSENRLFIARDDRVLVMDAGTGKLLAQIPGMQHAHGVALAPNEHRAYISNGHGNSIAIVDTTSYKLLGQIPVGGQDPDAILMDPTTGHVLAMDGHSNEISVIDTTARKEIARIPLPSNPEFGVADDKGNLWVNLEDAGELAHIDLKTSTLKEVRPLAPCEGPTGLSYDSVNQRLFSVCANGKMVVTDARNGRQVAVLDVGKHPDADRWDAKRKLVTSSSRDGTISVVRQLDADHYRLIQTVTTLKSARTEALDPASGKLFVAGADFAERGKPVKGFQVLVASPNQ